jgi:8-oxo-dGTP pyrophosphatase MutT (NUDIX family)
MQAMQRIRVLSAGVALVRPERGAWRFLLLRAYRSWDFPKGMVEAGEEPLAAARREVREETTIDDVDFAFGLEFVETGPYSRHKVARYYLGMTRTAAVTLPPNPVLGVPEHHEWRWVSYDEGSALVSPRVAVALDWAWDRLQAAPAPA